GDPPLQSSEDQAYQRRSRMELVLVLLSIAAVEILIFGSLGTWVARQKKRDPAEGLFLGGFFGPFGVLVELLLPTGNHRRSSTRPSRSDFWDKPPRPEWLEELGASRELNPTQAWLKDLEDRQRPRT